MENLPQDWLYHTLTKLDERMSEHGKEMRLGFADLRDAMQRHEKDDQVVEKRVTLIEKERELEAQIASRRGMWAGFLAAAGLSGVVEAAKHFWFK